LEFDRLDGELQDQIRTQMAGYSDPVGFYIDKAGGGNFADLRRRLRRSR